MSEINNIVMFGDSHYGSKVALYPEKLLPRARRSALATRYLNSCFEYWLEKECPKDIDLLMLTGDIIDGPQRKSEGTGVYTSSYEEQTEAAIMGLRPLCRRAKKIVRVWGTPYHEGFQNCLSTFDAVSGVGKVAQVIDYELDGKILNIAHHPTGGSALYTGTAVDKECLWATIAEAERNVPKARWIVRAHKHCYMQQDTRFKTVLLMPCWQLPTAHAIKTNYWRFQPSIGAAVMRRDSNHDSGFNFRTTMFDLPITTIVKHDDIKARAEMGVNDEEDEDDDVAIETPAPDAGRSRGKSRPHGRKLR